VFVVTPFERIKVFFMTTTSNSDASLRNFFNTNQKNGIIKELFTGLEPIFWKNNISWFTFLFCDFKLKTYWKKKKEREILKNSELLIIAFFVGLANTLTSTYKYIIKYYYHNIIY